jgi:hypothetical protein
MSQALQTTKALPGELVTVEGDLPTVVGALAQNLQAAVTNMVPDDVLVELDCCQDAMQSRAKLRFRAYKRSEV